MMPVSGKEWGRGRVQGSREDPRQQNSSICTGSGSMSVGSVTRLRCACLVAGSGQWCFRAVHRTRGGNGVLALLGSRHVTTLRTYTGQDRVNTACHACRAVLLCSGVAVGSGACVDGCCLRSESRGASWAGRMGICSSGDSSNSRVYLYNCLSFSASESPHCFLSRKQQHLNSLSYSVHGSGSP